MNSQENDNIEEEIEILYNSCYGGWGISDTARELYRIRNINNSDNNYLCRRSNPILIQIYKELGDKFDRKYSNTKIKKIPKIYKNYYIINEYDGLETVEIDLTQYILDNLKNNIKEILENNSIDNDEKINSIKKIIYLM